jgi:lipoprotein-releasing system permease protein
MNFEWWLTFRYLSAKKDKFLSVINFVAIAGIAIGVMALIIVIGVMTGFDHDLREKIVGANAHVFVEKETGLKNYQALNERLMVFARGLSFHPVYPRQCFFRGGDQGRQS